MLYIIERGAVVVQHVSAEDIASSLLSVAQTFTGFLPENTLFYIRKGTETEFAIYREPRVQKIAIVTKPLEPPERFTIPLPGLVFICSAGRPPKVFAVKKRPTGMDSEVFNAMFPNTYHDGRTCAGNNKYPENVAEIPDNFFMSFFSLAHFNKASISHPDSLIALYKELEGKTEYPLTDMIRFGTLAETI
jgi:hypothetical protein